MKSIFIFILVILVTYFAGQWLSQNHIKITDASDMAYVSLCDPTKNICVMDEHSAHFNIHFNGVPSALTPFIVLVKVAGSQPESIELSFDMEGMDMGYNKHSLNKHEIDWQKKVILPVCSLGRNDWILNVKMMFDNETVSTQYKFSQTE